MTDRIRQQAGSYERDYSATTVPNGRSGSPASRLLQMGAATTPTLPQARECPCGELVRPSTQAKSQDWQAKLIFLKNMENREKNHVSTAKNWFDQYFTQ
jgi:hypothetical protein